MVSRQLELGFANQPGLRPAGRGRGRSNRARWWFEQMREVVNHAHDWPPADLPANPVRPAVVPHVSALAPPGTPVRTSAPSPPARMVDPHAAPETHRCRSRRTRRLVWE